MKKINNISKEKQDEVIDKLLALSLIYEKENSKRWIELVNYQIKGYEIQKQHLIDNKPYFFQKKKLIEHNKKIEELNNKIIKCLRDIEEELENIFENEEIINKNN